jgi:RNA polymerase sigma-70 factor (ECF subfamily)
MTSLNKDIWQQIQQGDEKAFEFVFRSYYSMLCSYAYDIISDYDQAREIVQDVFVRIWENRSLIEINSSIKSIFSGVCNNYALITRNTMP